MVLFGLLGKGRRSVLSDRLVRACFFLRTTLGVKPRGRNR